MYEYNKTGLAKEKYKFISYYDTERTTRSVNRTKLKYKDTKQLGVDGLYIGEDGTASYHTKWTYDTLSTPTRIGKIKYTDTDGGSYTEFYTYDTKDRIKIIERSGGSYDESRYTYDKKSRIKTIINQDIDYNLNPYNKQTIRINYDKKGNINRIASCIIQSVDDR